WGISFSDRSSKTGFCQLHYLFPRTSRRKGKSLSVLWRRVRDRCLLASAFLYSVFFPGHRDFLGKQDSTNGVRKSLAIFSLCLRPSASNDRNFLQVHHKVDKSVFVLPENSVLQY
ncbi:hypothetical protein TNCV_228821, partial [Trichonephila clavipes]